MSFVFTNFFGRTTPHFIVYMFSGMLVFSCFRESTSGGMQALMSNAGIISKTNAPKYMFLMSKNVSVLINFALALIVFFVFVVVDGIELCPQFLLLAYPIFSLFVFNIGVGLVLSALFVFFRDLQYLYDIFIMLLMWFSAIFYPVESFSLNVQHLFLLNPIFAHIHYFRLVVLYGLTPSLLIHFICGFYALVSLAVGCWIYKRYNYRFVFYM